MSRIRITCKGEPPSKSPSGLIVQTTTSFVDTVVTYIDDNGRETDISDTVQGVHIVIEANAEPVRAIVTFIDVEADVEVTLDSSKDREAFEAGVAK